MSPRTAAQMQNVVLSVKRLWYGSRGEPIRYGNQHLRYVPGTRPVRLKYLESTDVVVRNDAKQIEFFIENVRDGDFVLDVGGNLGQYAVLLRSLVGKSGRVISFEPDSGHCKILRRNLELNGFEDDVSVEELALSDMTGTHAFFSRDDQMSSLVKSGLGSNADSADVRKHLVQTRRLDDYLISMNLDFPDWAKIDTEGAEINILRGAQKLLRSKVIILCELHPYAWPEFGTSYDEFLSLVYQGGRKITYLDPAFKIEDGPQHGTVVIS